MSLEVAIAENTAAIRDLIAALSKAPAIPAAEPKAEPAPKAEKPKPELQLEPKVEEQKPEPKAEEPKAAAAAVDYADVQAAILTLNRARGRDVVLEVLGRFNATKGPELDPADYEAALDALREEASA